jgi:hypothetical protein
VLPQLTRQAIIKRNALTLDLLCILLLLLLLLPSGDKFFRQQLW